MEKCYVIVEKTEYLSKNLHYDPEVKVLCVYGNYESAVKRFLHMQKRCSHDVEWGEFKDWFSYKLSEVHPMGMCIFPRETAKITVSLKRVEYIAD